MPKRPMSHSERLGRQESDAVYDRRRREPVQRSSDVHEADIDPQTKTLSLARQIRHAKRWQKCREMVLRRNPLCVDPYGWHASDRRVVVAVQVDHIVPLATRPDLAYDLENLQGLCTMCHATKSQEERSREKPRY